MESRLDHLVEQARDGDEEALEAVVLGIQDRIYNLALRMLWHPSDAEDATQEILLKVITHLSQFRQESAFMTWVYQIAKNYLLTTRRQRAETTPLSFAFIGDVLEAVEAERAQANPLLESPDGVEQDLLVKEVQLRCTLGMLLCLDREHRLAYILGEVFEVSSAQGASILTISETAFRKRVSRARARLQRFMGPNCNLVNESKDCNCVRNLDQSSSTEKQRLAKLLATFPLEVSAFQPDAGLLAQTRELGQLERVAAIFRSHPSFASPDQMVLAIKRLLASEIFRILEM
ncbi:MAG TPA: RNA polymerase sigma factor [Ktedonobacteraceae bacterium]|nr:RNA polymerase sigma factor [Ktedonobacteraceae bacterium]